MVIVVVAQQNSHKRSATDAIVGCDTEGRITAWNRAAERIYGYRCAEVRRRPVTMMFPADVADRDWQMFQAALRGVTTSQLRTDRLHKDGTRIPVRMSFAPLEGVDGSVRGVVSVGHELTDEIKSEARMAALLQATPDAIVGLHRDGRIAFANRSCEKLLGYRPDELIGRQARMLFPEDVRAAMIDLRERLFADAELRAQTHTVPTRILRKDGMVLPSETTLSWHDEPGEPLMIAAMRDLSELHRAESRLRALLEAVPDAITGIDADGRIVMVNQCAEQLLGYPRSQLLGRPYTPLLPDSERERAAQAVAAAFAAREQRTVAYADVIRADGSLVSTENILTRFDTGGESILLILGRDITDRVAAERERVRLIEQVQRQRAEQAILRAQRLETLGRLAGGVAHDFNNLLAVIANYADLLHEEVTELAGADPQRWRPFGEDLARIQQAAQRGAALTQQLLTFSGRDLNRPQVLAPAAALERLLPALRTAAGELHAITTDTAAELWPILLDPGQLEQILVTLTANARDALPDGGPIRIAVDNFRAAPGDPAYQPPPEPEQRYLRLRVIDDGTGMTSEVAARAFEPFFTTKAKNSGAGLGLAAVHGIVGQAGGCLAIESRPGAGTTMTVLLPATDRTPSSPARTGTGPAEPPPRVVLLVDDEEGVRESTARLLTHHGYQVLTAHDGLDALRLAQQHRDQIDVLLTDLVMPKMHGGELARRVADLIPGVRVIFMSGYAEPLLDTAPTDSAVPLLKKPFTTADLLRIVTAGTPSR